VSHRHTILRNATRSFEQFMQRGGEGVGCARTQVAVDPAGARRARCGRRDFETAREWHEIVADFATLLELK